MSALISNIGPSIFSAALPSATSPTAPVEAASDRRLESTFEPSAASPARRLPPASSSLTGQATGVKVAVSLAGGPLAAVAAAAMPLTPEDYSRISQAATGGDSNYNPVNQAADQLSNQLLSDFQSRAAASRDQISAENQAGRVPLYEVGVIGGAGIHGAEFLTALQALAPHAKVIGIDGGDGHSQTFDSNFFHLNSSLTATMNDTPLLYAPNQLRDLMPEVPDFQFPRARALANGNHNELGALDADYLLNERVSSVRRDADGLFTITGKDGLEVRARKVVSAVGFGTTQAGFLDPESQAFLQRSRSELKQGRVQGLAVSFDDLKAQIEADRLAGKPDAGDEHRLDGLDKIVVGSGDGGAVVVEHETGPDRSGQLFWLGQPATTGADYIARLRYKKRYGDLAPRIDSKEVQSVPGQLSAVRQIQVDGKDKVEATYKTPDGQQKKLVGDVLVLASGYAATPDIYGGMTPHYFANAQDPEIPTVWGLAKSREQWFDHKFPELAANETPGFYSAGVDGLQVTGMPSVSAAGGLTVQIAKEVAGDVQVQRPTLQLPASEGARSSLELDASRVSARNIAEPKIALAGVRTELMRAAGRSSFGADLDFTASSADDKLTLALKGIAPDAGRHFLEQLAGSPAFLGYLKDSLNNSGSLSLQAPHLPGGGLRMDQAVTQVPAPQDPGVSIATEG